MNNHFYSAKNSNRVAELSKLAEKIHMSNKFIQKTGAILIVILIVLASGWYYLASNSGFDDVKHDSLYYSLFVPDEIKSIELVAPIQGSITYFANLRDGESPTIFDVRYKTTKMGGEVAAFYENYFSSKGFQKDLSQSSAYGETTTLFYSKESVNYRVRIKRSSDGTEKSQLIVVELIK